MGFLTALARISLDMTVVTMLILCLPGLPPFTTFGPIDLSPAPQWTGPMKPNEKLNLVDRLFENKLKAGFPFLKVCPIPSPCESLSVMSHCNSLSVIVNCKSMSVYLRQTVPCF